jgi:superfamily II DNA or RNA helicase
VFKLRPYQQEAIDEVLAARERGVKRMVISLPTGAGKTVIFSRLAAQAERQVLVLAHREELLTQAKNKLERTLESMGLEGSVEIEQGEKRASPDAKIAVCSIRSLHPERLGRMMKGRDLELIIYDECHHAAATDNKRVLEQIGCFEHDWGGTLLGFTATTRRGDGQGLDDVFEEIIYSRTIGQMIADEYLTPLRGYRIATSADLVRVGKSGEDFNIEELSEAVDIKERNALVARSIQELARDRRTIAFCVTVAHAKNLSKALNKIGVPTGVIHGEMKREARDFVLTNFAEGRLQAITNVMVLTEGFDDPGVSCIAMARPTRSSSLYTQCVGRGTRLAEGKEDCLVLDFVDLSDVSLTTLPTLFGLPQDVQLDGEDVEEARQQFLQLWDDHPHLEIDPGEITLDEIKRRAASFDPLTLDLDPEITAISPLAWVSLGSAGLALHVSPKRGKVLEFLVLLVHENGRASYRVLVDDKEVAKFGKITEAVEAVDWEVRQRGPNFVASAQVGASWRQEQPDAQMIEALLSLKPPRTARTVGQALHYLAHARRARRYHWGKS